MHARAQVSWSSRPQVHLVPGSWEQRGTDLQRALRGLEPFCRPGRLDGAMCLVAGQLDTEVRL